MRRRSGHRRRLSPACSSATIVDREATARLLEPWLGSGLDIDELPVPRLVIVTIDEANPPDFAAMRAALAPKVPQAHRSTIIAPGSTGWSPWRARR